MSALEDAAAEALKILTPGPAPHFALQEHLFPKQDAFGLSKSRQRTACTSRRAGKSEAAVGILLDVALKRAGCVALYLTKTRINAKRIIWGILKRVNREYGLGGQTNESELAVTFPNGSSIYLAGASNREEIEKYRGMPIGVVVVDESQMLAAYLQSLVDEVLAAALMDYDGCLVLIGTPAPVPAGYFYDVLQNPAWEHFTWSVFDNPWILKKSGKTPQQHLEAECARRGVTPDDPTIQREWFGKWAYDPNALVFRYDAERNDYAALPDLKDQGEWECVIAGDIGWDDADALGVLTWNTTLPDVWLTEEDVMPKQTITQLGDKLKAMEARLGPLAIVLDFGGLGKKIAQELTSRWGLKVEAAEKERKLEHIELLNDAMRTGRFHAKKGSRFAQDCMLVEWDKSNPEKPKISDRYHSDACDMALYGYRKALHWLSTPVEAPPPAEGSDAWATQEQNRMREAAEEASRQRQRAQQTDEYGGWVYS